MKIEKALSPNRICLEKDWDIIRINYSSDTATEEPYFFFAEEFCIEHSPPSIEYSINMSRGFLGNKKNTMGLDEFLGQAERINSIEIENQEMAEYLCLVAQLRRLPTWNLRITIGKLFDYVYVVRLSRMRDTITFDVVGSAHKC